MVTLRLGVLGGTFDPVHLGHLVLAEQAKKQLDLAKVLWVPAGDPWRKSNQSVTAAERRLAMVQLAIVDNPAFELCMLEVERPGPTYSVDTLAALCEQHPESELVFIMGLDALEDLANWHEPKRLLELATLAVASRGGERPSPEALEASLPGLGRCVVWVEMPRIDISGTELRRWASQRRSLRYLVPDAVERYIREHQLYRSES